MVMGSTRRTVHGDLIVVDTRKHVRSLNGTGKKVFAACVSQGLVLQSLCLEGSKLRHIALKITTRRNNHVIAKS